MTFTHKQSAMDDRLSIWMKIALCYVTTQKKFNGNAMIGK